MKVQKRFSSVFDKRRELILLKFTSGLTSGLHVQDLQISTRGRPLWRRFAGSFLCEHSTMCRSTVSIREAIRGKRWSTARVILNAHLTYTKRRKPTILNATKKVLAARRNRSQGVTSLVPVVTECEGSRKGAGLEVGFRPNAFSVKKSILANSRLLTCPGIAGARDRL